MKLSEANIKKKIIENLKEVYDPEIPISVYELGLIYKIEKKKTKWEILMTFTSENCPTKDFLKESVEDAVLNVLKKNEFEVKITYTPRWNQNMVSDEIREELGFFDDYVNESDDLVKKTFENNNLKFCFNCNINSSAALLISGFYKNEKIYVCSKCLKKF